MACFEEKLAMGGYGTLEHGPLGVLDLRLQVFGGQFESLALTVNVRGVLLLLANLLGETVRIGGSLNSSALTDQRSLGLFCQTDTEYLSSSFFGSLQLIQALIQLVLKGSFVLFKLINLL